MINVKYRELYSGLKHELNVCDIKMTYKCKTVIFEEYDGIKWNLIFGVKKPNIFWAIKTIFEKRGGEKWKKEIRDGIKQLLEIKE